MGKKLYTDEHYGNDRKGWLKNRGFGGSSISALFGNSPYMNALDIYCSAVNPQEEINDSETESTIYGKKVEPILAQLFQLNFGTKYKLTYPQEIIMYRRIDKPFMTYTADGLLKEIGDKKRKGFVEFKSRLVQNKEDADNWHSGKIPPNYINQVLQGFAVLNDTHFCELFAILNYLDYDTGLIYKSELLHFHLERKDVRKAVKKVEQVQTDFHREHIEKQIPPNLEIEIEY